MQVQFELVIGQNKFTLTENVETHSEFFQKLSFYSTLPKTGPNGETDLVLTHRVAQGKYDYYSIVSRSAGLEYKLGQSQQQPGALFGKGWEPLYNANGEEGAQDQSQEQSVAAGQSVGLGATAPTPAAPPSAAATPAAKPASKPAAAKASTPAPAAPPVSNGAAQVQNQAKNVLSKFGI